MTQNISLAPLAEAHSMAVLKDDSITLHYDAGRDIDGDPVVYIVIESEDLCKLPQDVLSSLGIGADRREDNGDPVFFVGNDEILKLYVDTDSYPSFKADIMDIAEDYDIPIRDAHGDLRALCGENGDIAVPKMSAFMILDLERIDCNTALAMIEHERRATPFIYTGRADDAPGSEFC